MTFKTLRGLIAHWFLLLTMRLSALLAPTRTPVTPHSGTNQTLRLEADLETPLTSGQLATLLRNVAKDNAHAPTLLHLANAIENRCRVAPQGTRGTIILLGEDMVIPSEGTAEMLNELLAKTRGLTEDPGNLVEIQISVVVESRSGGITIQDEVKP